MSHMACTGRLNTFKGEESMHGQGISMWSHRDKPAITWCPKCKAHVRKKVLGIFKCPKHEASALQTQPKEARGVRA